MAHRGRHWGAGPSIAEVGLRSGACRTLVVVAAVLWIAGPATAAVYKWTDANGRVVYSDQPPPANVKVETLAAPPPPANPNAVKELAQKDAELRQRQAQRAEGEKKAEQARTDAELRRTQCAQARSNIGLLAAASGEIIYRPNEKGERVLMDDVARRREREQLAAWVRDNCAR